MFRFGGNNPTNTGPFIIPAPRQKPPTPASIFAPMGCDSCSNNKTGKPNGCKSNGYCTTSGCNKLDVFDWLTGVPLSLIHI